MAKVPLSLYVHFPWCLSKCPYCDFNSHQVSQSREELFTRYVDKLLVDLECDAAKVSGGELSSVYFGGGTPSLLPSEAIKKIIHRSKNLFSFTNDIEITLEANPGTINFASCESFKEAGINRISLGVQSFTDEKLRSIGRIHNAKEAEEAINAIKQAKFSNFNLDMMFGLPGQNIDAALDDLQVAMNFMPPHFSWYQLTVEPKTQFAIKPPVLPNHEELWNMQEMGKKMLEQAGLLQYEVSAYSKQGYECRHNINYWQYGDYLGVGAGAHGKITLDDDAIKRYCKIAYPKKYLEAQNSLVEGEENISRKKLPFEFMLNALRLYRPISHKLFLERTGMTIDVITDKLQYAKDFGLIELQNNVIYTTTKGKNFLNDLLEIFL